MTGQLVVALCIVWMPALLGVAGLCVYARLADEARADDLIDTWPPDVEDAICEALAVGAEDDFWLWQVENGWASA